MPAMQKEGTTMEVSLISLGPEAQKALAPPGPKNCERIAVPNTFLMTLGALPQLILPHTLNRKRSTIYVGGPGIVAIGQSMAEVEASLETPVTELIGSAFYIAGPAEFDVRNTTELWAALFNAEAPGTNPTPSQPPVPATGVAQQNVNSYPVQVVISPNGATITNVSVNGITVGTAAGTYTVPAYGAISIAYSVATPTWVWSNANAQATASPTWVSVIKEIVR